MPKFKISNATLLVIFKQCENVSQNVTHSLEDLVDAWRPNKLSFFHLLSAKVHQQCLLYFRYYFLNEEIGLLLLPKKEAKSQTFGFSDLLGASKFWLRNLFWARFTTFLATRKPWEKPSYSVLMDIIPKRTPPTKKLSADIEKKCKYIFNSVHHSNILISQYSRCLS